MGPAIYLAGMLARWKRLAPMDEGHDVFIDVLAIHEQRRAAHALDQEPMAQVYGHGAKVRGVDGEFEPLETSSQGPGYCLLHHAGRDALRPVRPGHTQ
jgi:hypothetical protein